MLQSARLRRTRSSRNLPSVAARDYGDRMQWADVRAAYPDRWLVVEALEAHSAHSHRIFDRLAVVDTCADGPATMKRYAELSRQHPQREFGFVHTDMVELVIEERRWVGIRGLHEADASR
jgi:hypothetical protein